MVDFGHVMRKCDLPTCNKANPLWNVFYSCGHSFHVRCLLLINIRECQICKATLLAPVEALWKTANDAVFAPATCADDHDSDDDTKTESEADDKEDDCEQFD